MKLEVDFAINKLDERIAETKRLTQILQQTLDRRYAPDQVMNNAITNIECELQLFTRDVRTLRKELGGAETTDDTS